MTIVVAQREGNRVWIGADSRITSHNSFIYPTVAKKWHKWGDWWMGCAGSTRLSNLIEAHALDPQPATEQALIVAVRSWIKDDEWNQEVPGGGPGPRSVGSAMLVVTPDRRVLDVSSFWAYSDAGVEFAAIGSGCDYAYGAAHAMRATAIPTEERMQIALEAACNYDTGCGEPLFVRAV